MRVTTDPAFGGHFPADLEGYLLGLSLANRNLERIHTVLKPPRGMNQVLARQDPHFAFPIYRIDDSRSDRQTERGLNLQGHQEILCVGYGEATGKGTGSLFVKSS